jgi:hypothetical protein
MSETDLKDTLAALSEAVELRDCPPGLFWFNGTLGFKSEYTTTLENPRRYQCDAYVVESGEYFWGGAKNTAERAKLMVHPIDAGQLVPVPSVEVVAKRLCLELGRMGDTEAIERLRAEKVWPCYTKVAAAIIASMKGEGRGDG